MSPHAAQAASGCKLGYVTDVPLHLAHRQIIVDVRIGAHTVPLMLDTGSNISTLSREAAAPLDLRLAAGLTSDLSELENRGIGGSRSASLMVAPHVFIGSVSVPQMRFAVQSNPRDHAAGQELSLLGMNPLANFDIDLDLIGGRMALFQPGRHCAQVQVLMNGPLYAVPMVGDPRDTHIMVNVTLGGHPLVAALDTGAQGTALTLDAARRTGLAGRINASGPKVAVFGVGAHADAGLPLLLAPMSLGELNVANMRVLVLPNGLPGNIDMLLGMDFLSHVHTWIGNGSRTVVFQVPPTASPPVP